MPHVIAMLAGTREESKRWQRDNPNRKNVFRQVVFVENVRQANHLVFDEVVVTGTFMERNDSASLKSFCEDRLRSKREPKL